MGHVIPIEPPEPPENDCGNCPESRCENHVYLLSAGFPDCECAAMGLQSTKTIAVVGRGLHVLTQNPANPCLYEGTVYRMATRRVYTGSPDCTGDYFDENFGVWRDLVVDFSVDGYVSIDGVFLSDVVATSLCSGGVIAGGSCVFSGLWGYGTETAFWF